MQLVRNRIYMQLICCFFVTLVLAGCSIDKETKDDSSHVPEPSAPEMPYSESNLQNIIKEMSIEEKVGQLFIVRCPVENQVESITDYHLGGYILFSRDFKGKTKQKLIEEIQSYQASSEIKMLISVDEEGGEVNRLSLYKSFRAVPFWSAQDIYRKGGWELITRDTVDKAKFLKSLGINVNMAPVCDVSENPNDYIYKRTFGKNAEETSRYVETVVKAMSDEKLGSVLKHFPGYGNNEVVLESK